MEESAVILAAAGVILILGGPIAGYFVFRYRYGERMKLVDKRERQLKSRELKLNRARRAPAGSPFESRSSESEDTIGMLREEIEQKSLELSISRQDYDLEIRVLKEESASQRIEIARLRGEPVEVQDIEEEPNSDLTDTPSAPAESVAIIDESDRARPDPPQATPEPAAMIVGMDVSHPAVEAGDDALPHEEGPPSESIPDSEPDDAPESEPVEFWVMSEDSSDIGEEQAADVPDIYEYLYPEDSGRTDASGEDDDARRRVTESAEEVPSSEQTSPDAAEPTESEQTSPEIPEPADSRQTGPEIPEPVDSRQTSPETPESTESEAEERSPSRPDRPPKSFEPRSPEETSERIKDSIPLPEFMPVSELMGAQEERQIETAEVKQIVQLPDEQYRLLTDLGYATLDKIACLSSTEVHRLSDIFHLQTTVIESDWIPSAQLKLFERDN